MAKARQQPAAPAGRQDIFWWLADREALLKRFILSQALGEPRCRRPCPGLWGEPGPGRPRRRG